MFVWEMALAAGLLWVLCIPFPLAALWSWGFSSLGSDQRRSPVAVLCLVCPRDVSFAGHALCSVTPPAQPSLDPSSGHRGWEQGPVLRCQLLVSFVLATTKLHLLPSMLSRDSLSFRSGDHTWFKSTLIATPVWQQTLFTICNYLTASLQQTPGTCCYI